MLKTLKFFVILAALFIFSVFFAPSAVAQTGSQNDEDTPRSVFYTYTGSKSDRIKTGKGSSKTGKGTAGKTGKNSNKVGNGKSGNNNQNGNSASNKIKLPPVKPKPPKIQIVRYKKPNSPGKPQPKPQPRPKTPTPGAEIKVELTRAGITDFVPLDTLFQTGEDRVKLSIRTNFPAYVAVINRGSSGKISQLFPCNRGENFIQPLSSFEIPNTFKFSGEAGVDEVLFLLSRQPLPLVNEIAEEGLTVCKRKSLNDVFQKQIIENNLSTEESGRDLEIADDYNNEGEPVNYLLLTEQLLKKTVVYKIRLRHQ